MYNEEENNPISLLKNHLLIPSLTWIGTLWFYSWYIFKFLEALSSFNPQFYDLVLLSVRIEGMNGSELCKEMQKRLQTSLMLNIALSHILTYRGIKRGISRIEWQIFYQFIYFNRGFDKKDKWWIRRTWQLNIYNIHKKFLFLFKG